ncbi:hypothetical protein KL86DES1_22189 [uncultured Desulfovibrio sp.]|uniref:Uncharacterized protein n=1 Tax=uncultured Desulfovibrio sp. TaxID=167968 RepID=A0A212LB90_9BACT|nr:hypothetical protein KL86DES1_22189 [uncultured Desulfovibrio sp.]VZH35082.1 conserved protein of unknown function [Desulfovibrio sp. 86]
MRAGARRRDHAAVRRHRAWRLHCRQQGRRFFSGRDVAQDEPHALGDFSAHKRSHSQRDRCGAAPRGLGYWRPVYFGRRSHGVCYPYAESGWFYGARPGSAPGRVRAYYRRRSGRSADDNQGRLCGRQGQSGGMRGVPFHQDFHTQTPGLEQLTNEMSLLGKDFPENPCREMREGRLLPAVSEHFKVKML